MDEIRLQIHDVDTQHQIDALVDGLDVNQPSRAAAAIDPVTGALIIAGVIVGAKLVMRLVSEWRGGVILELSHDPIDVRRNRAIPYGVYVVVAKDGELRIETKGEPEDALERMVLGLLEAILPSRDQVEQAVKAAAVPNAIITRG